MTAILSEKGHITIPKELRQKLGLLPGAVLEIDAVNGKLGAARKWRKTFSRSGGAGGVCREG